MIGKRYQGKRKPLQIYVPPITKSLFIEAEKRAHIKKPSLGYVNKGAYISVYGQKKANAAFPDSRVQSREYKDLKQKIKHAVLMSIDNGNGITTKEAVLDSVAYLIDLDWMQSMETPYGCRKIEPGSYYLEQERQIIFPAAILHRKGYINSIAQVELPIVIESNGLSYGKPTNEQKRQFGIKSDKWIIARKCAEYPEEKQALSSG